MRLKHKAFAYITHGNRLLVFDHVHYPEAGTQVPAGTILPGECPEAAVLREAEEETGLTGLRLVGFLGEVDFVVRSRNEVHRRRFYHLACTGPPPESWTHYERSPSDGTTEPILFKLYWVDLPGGLPPLPGGLPPLADGLPPLADGLPPLADGLPPLAGAVPRLAPGHDAMLGRLTATLGR
ncbi:MAG: NUDIX domain-containing protein [Candidatus Hydrogenedentes bacterium]|nr:NUDIX domain-containing protein [Candidatus Hydrogenedentota bacterium]